MEYKGSISVDPASCALSTQLSLLFCLSTILDSIFKTIAIYGPFSGKIPEKFVFSIAIFAREKKSKFDLF